MSARDCLQAEGTVVAILSGEVYRVELANGHRAMARPEKGKTKVYELGDKVRIAFHPYDLSRGRIVR
jgi:translation initiation factor IF-1